jgi:hypothetical protein
MSTTSADRGDDAYKSILEQECTFSTGQESRTNPLTNESCTCTGQSRAENSSDCIEHEGTVYHQVHEDDRNRADVARLLEVFVAKDEYSVYCEFYKALNEASEKLDASVAPGCWADFRTDFVDIQARIQGSQILQDGLKEQLRSRFEGEVRLKLQQQMRNGLEKSMDVLNLSFRDVDDMLVRIITPRMSAALCGRLLNDARCQVSGNNATTILLTTGLDVKSMSELFEVV